MNELFQLKQKFEHIFSTGSKEARIFFAPGRVNLIGEHTDYTGGFVFPAALTIGTWAIVTPRTDGRFRLASTAFDNQLVVDADNLTYREEDGWANYPKGIIREFNKMGVQLKGCDLLFHGNIPNGAGLSSSASIELVTAVALKDTHEVNIPMLQLVQLAQRAENQFVGVHSGIMDQFAVGMGKADHAVLLKCDTLNYRYTPLRLGAYQLVITNTNKRRGLGDSKYNERRKECEEGFTMIKQALASSTCLGDVTVEQWEEVKRSIRSEVIRRRLEHVVRENARVAASTKVLEAGYLEAFGQYMIQSHESLRDLYQVTGFELDTLFEETRNVDGCIGTRMTGAGFGGCTVSLVHKDALEDFKSRVVDGYQGKTGLTPTFYVCAVGNGAREVTEEAELCLF
ncbi:galactokinase [Effusibacillus consociatus]|uniref:Galactokinase n=1 Tax=Effusibacillus consociatus TaxID=1117041 RepID=A0ABV9PVA3_9BACL